MPPSSDAKPCTVLASVQDNVPSDSSSELLDDDEGKELSAALDAADELTLDGIELVSSAELELDATELTTELTDELLAAGRELLVALPLDEPPPHAIRALVSATTKVSLDIFMVDSLDIFYRLLKQVAFT